MARNIWEGLGAGIIGAGNAVGSAIAQMPTKEEKELMRLKLLAGQQDLETGKQGMDLNALKMKQAQVESEQAAQAAEARKSDLAELGRIGSLVDYSKQGLSGEPTIEMGADKGMFDAIAGMKAANPEAGSMSLPSESPLAKQSPLQIARSSQILLSSTQPEVKTYLENLGKEETESTGVTDREKWEYEKKLKESEAAFKEKKLQAELDKLNKEASEVLTPEQSKAAKDLRGEYITETKDFRQIRDSYNTIKSTNKGTAASDMSMIFAYMKMLDPNSTVREGEYAQAEQATGVPSRILNSYNKALEGVKLTPDQRNDFVDRAKDIYSTRERTYRSSQKEYKRLARDYGVPDKFVIVEYANEEPSSSDLTPQEKARLEELRKKRGN